MRLILTQHKYIHELLLCTYTDNSKGVSTPMLPTDKLSLHDDSPLSLDDATSYRSVVDALQYLCLGQLGVSIYVCTHQITLSGCQAYTAISSGYF
jgi:hypothetical protein